MDIKLQIFSRLIKNFHYYILSIICLSVYNVVLVTFGLTETNYDIWSNKTVLNSFETKNTSIQIK